MGRQWQTDANALSRKLHLAFICIGAYRSVAVKAGSAHAESRPRSVAVRPRDWP